MELTKYEHACFTIEKDGKLLIVDPGVYTNDLQTPENVVAVVVTHEHADHFDPAALDAIIAHNPKAIIIAEKTITEKLSELPTATVEPGDKYTVPPFMFEFFGGEHALIHSSMPVIGNLGVMINDTVYYPGDSFTLPNKPVDVLALPISAPWLKLGDTMDYLIAIKPRLAFPTHDALLSPIGKSLPDNMLPNLMKSFGGEYKRLIEPIEL